MRNYKKLSKQPLVFVLTELRFSAILDMEKYIPKIQDLLRVRFPNFRRNESQEIAVLPTGISLTTQPNWEFISKDQKEAAVIDQNRLLFITSKYERFEGFSENCSFLLNTLLATANPSLLLRVGLRYSDTITDIEGQGLAEEFVQSRLFENADLHSTGSPIRQTNETLVKTSEGLLFVRSMHGINNLLVWPDAENLPLAINKISAVSSNRILLDIDHMWDAQEEEATIDFEQKFILDKLTGMHQLSRQAFWDITTEKAKEAWQ